jgi:ATP-dependent Lhr-like helicase
VLAYLDDHGASFFAEIHQGTGGGFPQETVDALWDLVWAGRHHERYAAPAARLCANRRQADAARARHNPSARGG